MTRTVAVAVALLALVAGAAACGDDGGGTTTVPTGAGSVVFGEGELPGEFPDQFPLPDGSVIGSTLVTATRTEVAMVVRQPLEDVARFFETELPPAGYDVVESAQQQFNWTITFVEPGIDGSIVLNPNGELTQLVVQLDAA